MDMAAGMATSYRARERVSEAAQTAFRESETQYVEWDLTKEPTRHPSSFPRGRGLHYATLYDPAWPVHKAARKKDVELPISKKKNIVGSYALKGMTLSATERRPIKKTMLFPHRNTDLPFRQPMLRVFKEPAYELCDSLSLQGANSHKSGLLGNSSLTLFVNHNALEELEPHVIYKSILERMPPYDVNDKHACAMAIRKVFSLDHPYVDDQGPPIPRQRKSRRQRLQTKAKDTQSPLEKEGNKELEIIFVDEGLKCGIHGATIGGLEGKKCKIHGDSEIIEEEEMKVLEED